VLVGFKQNCGYSDEEKQVLQLCTHIRRWRLIYRGLDSSTEGRLVYAGRDSSTEGEANLRKGETSLRSMDGEV
jgi:hypothetical protein